MTTGGTRVVVWRVTAACELTCPFCRFSRDVRGPRASMAAEEVARIGGLLAESQRATHLSWLGGEPTLWPPLASISHRLHAAGLTLGITTHGAGLADPALLALLGACFARVTLSLDGLDAAHDTLRGQAGLFDTVATGVKALAATKRQTRCGPLLHVNTVLMRSNLGDLPALCAQLADWGVEELTFNELGGRDRPGPFFERQRLRPADIATLRAWLPPLQAHMAARGLRIVGSPRYLDRLTASAAGEPMPGAACRPGEDFLFIDERGRVAPCSFTVAEYGVPLTELRTAADLAALPSRFAAIRTAHPAPICYNCPSTHVFGKFEAQP